MRNLGPTAKSVFSSKRFRVVRPLLILIAFTYTTNVNGQLADSPWPKFQHDLQNTGRSQFNGYQNKPNLLWSFGYGGTMYREFSPVIGSDGTIYIGSGQSLNDAFYAINPDGTEKWVFSSGTNRPISTTPAIDKNGIIYVGSDDGRLRALNQDGTLEWTFNTGNSLRMSPSIGEDGTIYIPSGWNLYAITNNSTEKWSLSTRGAVGNVAIGKDGTIYFRTRRQVVDDSLRAVNSDGKQKWSVASSGKHQLRTPIIGLDGTIYISASGSSGSSSFYLDAYNPNGSLKWSFTLNGWLRESPMIGSDGTIYAPTWNGLYAINPDGSLKWLYSTNDNKTRWAVLGADDKIYMIAVGTRSENYGSLSCISPEGVLLWSVSPAELGLDRSWLFFPIIGKDGTLYVHESIDLHALGKKVSLISDLQLTPPLTFNPDPPVAGNPTQISFNVRNVGNKTWTARDLIVEIRAIDWLDKGPGDSFWLQVTQNAAQIRQDDRQIISFDSDIQPGNSVTKQIEFTFSAPDFTDQVEIALLPAYEGQLVDDSADINLISTDANFVVDFSPEAYFNCFGELLTGLTHGVINKTHACYSVVALRAFWDNGARPAKTIEEILGLFQQENYKDAAKKSVGLLFDFTTNIVEQLVSDPTQCGGGPATSLGKFTTFLSFIQAAKDELSAQGCGAILVHHLLRTREYATGLMEAIHTYASSGYGTQTIGVVAASPVNLRLINQNGDINSVDISGNQSIGIDSSLAFIFGETKCILVSGNETFTIEMEGTATGTADLIVVQGKENGNYSTLTYKEVPITTTTLTSLVMSSSTTDYALNIDTDGDGNVDITKTPDEIITNIKTQSTSSFTFDLYDNYPNPFNPVTRINYELSSTSHVKIEVVNVLGQLIRTLVNQQETAGMHTAVWDGKQENGEFAPSGVYIYQMKYGSFSKSKKLLLLR